MPKASESQYKITDPVDMIVRRQPPVSIHPGVFVRDTIMPEYGLNVAQLARLIKVNRSNLHGVLSGQRDLSREMAYRLGALLNDHLADFLISYQMEWGKHVEAERRAHFKAEIERLPLPG